MKQLHTVDHALAQHLLERTWKGVQVEVPDRRGRIEIGTVLVVEARKQEAYIAFDEHRGLSLPITKLRRHFPPDLAPPPVLPVAATLSWWQRVRMWFYRRGGSK